MYLKRHPQNFSAAPRSQHGSMLVIALFVIIVLAFLGQTMTRLLSSSSENTVHEVLGQRAINAAKSGIECAVAANFGLGCPDNLSKEFSGVNGLKDCSYNVTLAPPKNITDDGESFTYLTFTSVGQCTAGKMNVSRTVYITVMLPT